MTSIITSITTSMIRHFNWILNGPWSLWLVCALVVPIAGAEEILIYHPIRTDSRGHILPWSSDEPGKAYDHAITSVWRFWDTMRADLNGLPYYMNHQVWKAGVNDPRGIGGDQIQMALSSWRLLYAYSGNERVKENMRFMADYYISHGFSPHDCAWPNIPFPYNTLVYSGIYDGDMVLGKGYTQPDKAGSFGHELVLLHKMIAREQYPNVTDDLYLITAIRIADTLAKHTTAGDEQNSPLPFKVNVYDGEVGKLKDNADTGEDVGSSSYTSNWCGTMELFMELIEMEKGDVASYQRALNQILAWMTKYPLESNRWGPFFEDIPGWSDTQINAITFAQFMMNHPSRFPNWRADTERIFDWVYTALGNKTWQKYGVVVVNEQTVYQTPGNSHTARQASAELQFAALTDDNTAVSNAVLQLNWATYMVDHDGKNRYPQDENWLTDGYGDYVRHYLRSMAARPELAPANECHLLSSTSVIQQADYPPEINKFNEPEVTGIDLTKVLLHYRTFDQHGREVIRMPHKPAVVMLNSRSLAETSDASSEGFNWQPLGTGGLLIVNRANGKKVTIVE